MPTIAETAPRVAVIGIDAADARHLRAFAEDGRMPNLARFRARAAEYPVEPEGSLARPWETFLRPEAPARDVNEFDPTTYAARWMGAVVAPPFFAGPDAPRTIMLDVPFSTLAGAGDWLTMVNAWGVHNAGSGDREHPAGILHELTDAVGRHPTNGVTTTEWHNGRTMNRFGRRLATGARLRGDATAWLLGHEPEWNLLITVFNEVHSASESMLQGLAPEHLLADAPTSARAGERLTEVYEAVDQALGRILGALPTDATVIVTTLHGNRPIEEDPMADVILPEVLHRHYLGKPFIRNAAEGWLESGARPLVLAPRWHRNEYLGWLARQPKRAPGIHYLARVAGRGRHRLRQWRAARHPAEGRYAEDRSRTIPAWYRRHWNRMPAFAVPTYYFGRVRINVAGREAAGMVDPVDYLTVRDEVEGLVTACRDARTGRPVVAEVRRADTTDGSGLSDDVADLLFTFTGQIDAVTHPVLGVIGPFPLGRTSSHRPEGVAWVSEPLAASPPGTPQSIADLSRFVLSRLGRHSVDSTPAG